MSTLLALLASYLLGGFCAGYYLVRVARAHDVRSTGSGSAGARNVGRLLGTPGFVFTLVLDAAKGALAVASTDRVAPGVWPATLALLAVVAGHIWPLQLGWRGGKGVSTALGGLAAWFATADLALDRRSAIAGAVLGFGLAAMTLWAHRENLAAARARRAAPSATLHELER